MPNKKKSTAKSREPKRHLLSQWAGVPPLCNGAQTGKQCVHYWALVHQEALGGGMDLGAVELTPRRDRYCTQSRHKEDRLVDASGNDKMARYCSRYAPSKRKYDPQFEEAVSDAKPSAPAMMPKVPTVTDLIPPGAPPPPMYPPPRDWDAEPNAPTGGFMHLEIRDNRTACAKGLMAWSERVVVPQDSQPRTTTDHVGVDCPGCVTEVQLNPDIVDAAHEVAAARGVTNG